MQRSAIIKDFEQLGQILLSASTEINEVMLQASKINNWFTKENSTLSFHAFGHLLTEKNLSEWLNHYPNLPVDNKNQKTIGLILAGNIPLVGFHDVLCVLIAGHKAMIKLSSQDNLLIRFVLEKLVSINPEWKDEIIFTDRLANFDAVIATGSNNTARYFDYYFGKYPHVIRNNRNSAAVLDGKESETELKNLCSDIFTYFGLGCRSVSKIYVPEDYNFSPLFDASYHFKEIDSHFKYKNNYDYNRTLLLMNKAEHLANEFLSIAENTSFQSPISVIYYEKYSDLNTLKHYLKENSNSLQCLVSSLEIENSIPFGSTQQPGLMDYADGVDIPKFLENLQ